MVGRALKKLLSGWFRKREGTTAIEFSLLSIPYFMLTLGIIELSIMFSTASLLEGATGSAARLVRTGQLQQTGASSEDQKEMFREALCRYAVVLVNCNDIKLDAVNIGNFSSYDDYAPQFDGDGNMIEQGFDTGGSSDVIMIRVSYRYNMMTPLVGPLLSGADGGMTFMSTLVLETEPYEFEGI